MALKKVDLLHRNGAVQCARASATVMRERFAGTEPTRVAFSGDSPDIRQADNADF